MTLIELVKEQARKLHEGAPPGFSKLRGMTSTIVGDAAELPDGSGPFAATVSIGPKAGAIVVLQGNNMQGTVTTKESVEVLVVDDEDSDTTVWSGHWMQTVPEGQGAKLASKTFAKVKQIARGEVDPDDAAQRLISPLHSLGFKGGI